MTKKEFENIIIENIIKYYRENDIKYTQTLDFDFRLFLLDYFEVLRKLIPQKKRRVYISSELRAKVKSSKFKMWKERFEKIRIMFENGDDIIPYLSVRAKKSGFNDKLLTCWDIHHIHFYPEKTRGDMLLFVLVENDSVYMIDVIPHNTKYVFSLLELLNTIYKSWPFLLEKYRVHNISKLSYIVKTDEEISKLRKAGINVIIQLENNYYLLDKLSSDGYNIKDVIYVNDIIDEIDDKADTGALIKMKICRFNLTRKCNPAFAVTYMDRNDIFSTWII